MTCDLRENNEQTVVRYLGGLNESIRNVVELQPYATLDEVSSLAHKVELQKKAKFRREPPSPPQSNYPTFDKETFPPPNPKPQSTPTATPLAKPNANKTPLNPVEKRRCYKCQGFGHIASECSNRRVVTLREFQEFTEVELEEEENEKAVHLIDCEEECVEEADEGELLVLRRDLNEPNGPNNDDQRESLFHTWCTINDQVCSLIVDGGSCANVASTTLVDKLQLKTEPHPHPHSIRWLNQGEGLKVSSRCLISFSIGKNYVDELWCDILPMNACHMLLGRPWLYDRRVTHDGFLNTYSLHKTGRKITLVPLSPHQMSMPKTMEPLKDGGVLSSFLCLHRNGQNCGMGIFNDSDPEPYFVDANLENLRANSFLEGEDDAHIGGVLHQNKISPSHQESKALNQGSKAENSLQSSPRTVVKTVIAPGWRGVFDRGKGQLVAQLIQPKEVQQVLVAMGEVQGRAELFYPDWASTSGHLVTLVT